MSDLSLDPGDLDAALQHLDLTPEEISGALNRIAENTDGLLLYGSRARGDFLKSSDFDILRLTSSWRSPTFKVGRVSVSSYTREQLTSASRTLFGTHLARDGRVLIEVGADLSCLIADLQPADPSQLLSRVLTYSTILYQSQDEKRDHYIGLVRLARYLLRTSIYASAMLKGEPCFSVRELAIRFDDPDLAILLASDPEVTGPPSAKLLDELTLRLESIIGPLPSHPFMSLDALSLAYWDIDKNLAALAIRAGSEQDENLIDYSDLPKVLL